MDNGTPRQSRSRLLLRALGYARPHRYFVVVILCLTLLVSLAGVAEPLLIKYIFDELASGNPVVHNILKGTAFLIGLAFVRELFASTSNWMTWRIRLKIHYGLLSETVDRLHRMPFDVHRKTGVGAVMTKMERSIQNFIAAVSELVFSVLPALTWLGIAMIVMFRLDWRMALIVLAFGPLPALIAMLASRNQTERERILMNRWGTIYSRFNEVLSGIVTVRSFAMEDYEKRRFLRDVNAANARVVRGIGYDSRMGALQNFTVTSARIAALGYGAYLIIQDEITLGTLMAFLSYVGGFFAPVLGLTGIYKMVNIALVSLEYVFGILDSQESIGDAPDAIELKGIRGEIEFRNVHFRYQGGRSLLRGINVHVRAGESIALVGPSGSGKSTLMSLLQRFYDPIKGEILIDNINIRKCKQLSIRKHIGVVLQDALLFNDTVRNNILYGRIGASKREIIAAAKAANADKFIRALEKGYDTPVGEKGSRLSVGERQRIAIARALLKDPPILILDEATSALDAELEAQVQEALQRLMTGRTTFIIAHRLSTVVNVDRILVLKHGRIVETGSHRELMERDGFYAQLVKTQTHGLISGYRR